MKRKECDRQRKELTDKQWEWAKTGVLADKWYDKYTDLKMPGHGRKRHSKTIGGQRQKLLLHSQLYLWGSPFWMRFLCVWPFSNPTIEVVTFRLRGWCMLGVFLLLAFTRLGHECQDLLSPCDGMHVCTDWTSLHTLIRKSFLGNGVRNDVNNSKGKIPSTQG